MSGAEVVAVVACVAAVVSAYHDGSQLFRAIRNRWTSHRRNEPSTTNLERPLERGPKDILTRWNAHSARLCPRYEEGDAIAREPMKDIVITIQGALLTHLRYAEGDSGQLDNLALLRASDYGRRSTISVLRELYQRLVQAAVVLWPVGAAGSPVVDPASSLAYYIDLIERLSSLPGGSSALPGLPSGPYLPALLTGSPPDMSGFIRQIESSSPWSSQAVINDRVDNQLLVQGSPAAPVVG